MPKQATAAEQQAATVQISREEYYSLKAAAELVRHPDVLIRTLEAVGRNRGESLEDAFEDVQTYRSPKRRASRSA